MAETEQQQSIFNLYSSIWFTKSVFNPNSIGPPQITTYPDHHQIKKQEESVAEIEEIVQISSTANLHVRSLSCDNFMNSISKISFNSDPESPKSVLIPKLQTIISGKESSSSSEFSQFTEDREEKTEHDKKVKQRKSKRNKSLSDLEFEELKGFMDLGFVFSEEDENDTELICMIPGLQQKQSKKQGGKMVSRPYLSEAWEYDTRKMKKKNMLMNWKIPVSNNEIDMKEHLRVWAHVVATTVRLDNT